MTDLIHHTKKLMCYWVLICLVLVVFAGCKKDDDHLGKKKDNTNGNLQLKLAWQTKDTALTTAQKSPSDDVCADFMITGIRILVKDHSGTIVAKSALLPCSDHSARLEVPPGSGYTVEVEGLIDDDVRWFGRKKQVTVIAGQKTKPVMVEMTYTGKPLDLSVTISPENSTAGVPTDTSVIIHFNKPIVPATVDNTSILITNGKAPVLGTLTYKPKTFEVIFRPEQELSVSTNYTVTVTTNIVDQDGQLLNKEISSQFSTAKVWFVDAEISPSGTGKSWEDPFSTITEAIASAGDKDQIWIKQGVYLPDSQIIIEKPVKLLGGFEGTETQHHQRNWKANETVVDGDGKRRCFYISSDASIDGFTITGGFLPVESEELEYSTGEGGAMYIDDSAPRIINCKFVENSIDGNNFEAYGGSITIYSGNPVIDGCTFENNYIKDNSSGGGGAIYFQGGGPRISNCIFKNNSVDTWKGSQGGAIFSFQAKPSTEIRNCLFENNTAESRAAYGGAIKNTDSNYLVFGCRFKDNVCGSLDIYGDGYPREAYGGAISNNNSDIVIQNTTFYQNRAISEMSYGGAINNNFESNTVIQNTTFYQNRANNDLGYGGAIYSSNSSNDTIMNSIIWDNFATNSAQFYMDETSNAKISFSVIKPEEDGSNLSGKEISWVNPRFGTSLHLRADSPCIDKADHTTSLSIDMDGEDRPQGIIADIGADEFVDNDHDQIPDYWESLHSINDPDKDEDDDQLSNLDEYNLGTHPKKAQPIFDASDRGAVNSDGDPQPSRLTSLCGKANGKHNNAFFVFDVNTTNTEALKSAAIRLELAAYNSNDTVTTIELWKVKTKYSQIIEDLDKKETDELHTDLGSGEPFGDFNVIPADGNKVLMIPLNQAAVNTIKSNSKNSEKFIIGISMKGYGHLLFSEGDENRIHQLVLIEE